MEGVAFLVLLLSFGLAGGIVGKIKGSSFWLWFAVSFFIPFGGLIAALLYRWDSAEPRRECPGCGRVLKLHDAVCTRCGTDLEFPETILPAEASARRAGT